MNKSTYLENIVLHLLNISSWTWVSASSTVKGTEAVSRRSDKARVNTKMFLIIININRDILRKYSRKDTSSFGHWSVTPNPPPSTSPEVFFWYLINDKTLVLEHSHLSETINYPKDKHGQEVTMARHHSFSIVIHFLGDVIIYILMQNTLEMLWTSQCILLSVFCLWIK